MTEQEALATHPGFNITCRFCGSSLVYVDNSLGFSATSGGWGSVDLVCDNCDHQVELVKTW
jgi:hypothetical protein